MQPVRHLSHVMRPQRHCTLYISRRTLLNFPNFLSSALSNPNEPKTQTYHERRVLPYTPEQLYQVVADVASYPSFIPFCTGSQIIRSNQPTFQDRKPVSEPLLMDAELTVGFLAFQESYVSKVTGKPYEMVEAVASSATPLFKTLVTTWRFQRVCDPPTPSSLVAFDLAYAFSNPVHAAVSEAFFSQVSKLMVRAFQDRCVVVYGAGKN